MGTERLTRSSANGHLRKAADGHLVKGGECNCCSPAIPDTLYVTLARLVGDLAVWNGKWTLSHTTGCYWAYPSHAYPRILLQWIGPGTSDWRLSAATAAQCYKHWQSGAQDPCDPVGAYSEFACDAFTCADPNTCVDSAGATCVVSLT